MASVGSEMVNPVTGERFPWRHTAASTSGAYCEFDLLLSVGAAVVAPHIHPRQREEFRIERGAITFLLAGVESRLTSGDERVVPAGTPHSWGQTGPDEAHVVVRLTPALQSEDFFETFCGLARAGKVDRRGLPRNPFQFAVLAHEFRAEFALASAPARVLARPLIAVLAMIGRRFGLRARYARYAGYA